MAFTLRWGILATGGIASTFSKDLLVDPKTRNVTDVEHQIVALASSTSQERAQQFVDNLKIGYNVECYGTYEELVEHPDIDIIYVATPHSMHYENCKLALLAGKAVLCEKAFTINEAQAAHLIEIAREKKLFLMEAVWTRFFPLCLELQRLLFEEKIIGKINRIFSDCGCYTDVDNFPTKHRLLNPDLGGGALLDIGVYALTWAFMTGYNDPDNKLSPPTVASNMLKNKYTHVDETTSIVLAFPTSHVLAVVSTSMRARGPEDDICRIQGEKGEITVQYAPYRPESLTIYLNEDRPKDKEEWQSGYVAPGDQRKFEIPGQGMFYEADECARCIRDGKLESDKMPWEESRLIMHVMDTVRKQNNLTYPAELERVDKM